jgi:hypothetical protein
MTGKATNLPGLERKCVAFPSRSKDGGRKRIANDTDFGCGCLASGLESGSWGIDHESEKDGATAGRIAGLSDWIPLRAGIETFIHIQFSWLG